MLDVFYSTRFKKDYKQAKKQGLDTEKLLDVVDLLAAQKQLPPELKKRRVTGIAGHSGFSSIFVEKSMMNGEKTPEEVAQAAQEAYEANY